MLSRVIRCRAFSNAASGMQAMNYQFTPNNNAQATNTANSPNASSYSSYPTNNYRSRVQQEDEPVNPTETGKSSASTMPFPEEIAQSYDMVAFQDASITPFSEEIVRVLQEPIRAEDVEIKADGSLYLPEIKYRKALLRAFGPGGWALVPRSPHSLQGGVLSREYALMCGGRFVSQARGHAAVHSGQSSPASFQSTASVAESVRSNALMRCCKDLGIACELWDGSFVSQWKAQFAQRRPDPSGRRMLWSKVGPNSQHQQQ